MIDRCCYLKNQICSGQVANREPVQSSRLGVHERDPQGKQECPCNLASKVARLTRRALDLPGPDAGAARRLAQLHIELEAVRRAANVAFQHVTHSKFRAESRQRQVM